MQFSKATIVLLCIIFGAAVSTDTFQGTPQLIVDALTQTGEPSYRNVTVNDAKKMIDAIPNLIVLDVRIKGEHSKGHIENAVLYPFDELGDGTPELDKNVPILIYCWSGKRSAATCRALAEKGFQNVSNMLGGLKAWMAVGYPTEPSHDGTKGANGHEDCSKCPPESPPRNPYPLDSREGKERSSKELKAIKDEIARKGTRWTAGETPASRKSFENRKLLCGSKFRENPREEAMLESPLDVIPPGTFDWRDVDGVDWMTSVKDQGMCGSCWAFGTLASMEALINIENDDPDMDVDLSEQFLVSYSGAGSCEGGWPRQAYDFIMDTGVPDESCLPYVASDTSSDPCPDWPNRAWSITGWAWVQNDADSMKWALQTHGPLGVAIRVPDDFLYYQGGIYEPAWSSTEWDEAFPYGQANHWVTLVGYDDEQGYWIVKNSWSPGWGEEGYGKIAYGVLEGHDEIIAILSVVSPTAYDHDLAVSLEAPPIMMLGNETLLNVTVHNYGLNNETDVELHLYVNGTTVSQLEIPNLANGTSQTMTCPWTPPEEDWYNVTAKAPYATGEVQLENNNATQHVYVTGLDEEILLVLDDDGEWSLLGTSRGEFESAIGSIGSDCLVWPESVFGRPGLEVLNSFDLVVWTCGDYWLDTVDQEDADTLMAYTSEGGNLLLEGEEIGFEHGSDDFMDNVAHATMRVDRTGAWGLTVTDPDHLVTHDLPTSFSWLIPPPFDDGVTPTNGGHEAIQYTGTPYTAVTVYEGSSDGSVVYYSFPLYSLGEPEGGTLAANSLRWLLGTGEPTIADFPTLFAGNQVRMIYPATSDAKPLNCSPAMVSDWLSSAYIYTKLDTVVEALDDNPAYVNQTSGAPLGSFNMISFGGPVVNPLLAYAESGMTPAADRAPVRYQTVGDDCTFQQWDGTPIPGASLPISVINDDQDMFVIEVFDDIAGRHLMYCYGFGWQGTYAAGKYFETTIYPNLGLYTDGYIIVKWEDTNGDGFVNTEADGDTYTVVATGP